MVLIVYGADKLWWDVSTLYDDDMMLSIVMRLACANDAHLIINLSVTTTEFMILV